MGALTRVKCSTQPANISVIHRRIYCYAALSVLTLNKKPKKPIVPVDTESHISVNTASVKRTLNIGLYLIGEVSGFNGGYYK